MATIINYVANGTHQGSKENIWVQIGAFYNLGSGQVTEFDSFKFVFQGKISCIFYTGDLDISLELTDHNAGAMNGPCTVSANGLTDPNAKYSVENSKLVLQCDFQGNYQSITIYQIYAGKETQVDLSGKENFAIHLQPV